VNVQGPEITFETTRANNLSKNPGQRGSCDRGGGRQRNPPSPRAKANQLGWTISITGGKIHVSVTALGEYRSPFLQIHLSGLSWPEASPPAIDETADQAIEKEAVRSSVAVGDLNKQAADSTKNLAIWTPTAQESH
jgi:hypothetical protein